MIFITTSPNDADMIPLLSDWGKPDKSFTAGDFGWWGELDGQIMVCGDRKKLPDLVNCVNDGRHIKQVQTAYEQGFLFQFVVVEAIYRCDPVTKLLQHRRGKGWRDYQPVIEYSRVAMYLHELSVYGGVRVISTSSPEQTAAEVVALYRTFQGGPDSHSSLKKVYSEPPPTAYLGKRPSLMIRIAKELPGVGWTRAHAAADHFPSVPAMVCASTEEWVKVDGIGKEIAAKVTTALWERK